MPRGAAIVAYRLEPLYRLGVVEVIEYDILNGAIDGDFLHGVSLILRLDNPLPEIPWNGLRGAHLVEKAPRAYL